MKVIELTEARDPNLKYTEKKAKDVVVRVSVELEGQQSAQATRLAKRFKRLDQVMKTQIKRRDEANAEAKALIESLFNAEDEVLTRVVETASIAMTLSKVTKGKDKPPKIDVNYEAAFSELAEMVLGLTEQKEKLNKKIEQIRAKHTTTSQAADTPAKLTTDVKLEEGVMDTLKKLVNSVVQSIKNWATGYDKQLAAFKKKYKLA
jgi:hypothetical protein